MEKIRYYFTQYYFTISIICILLLASTLRFYDYYDRWGLAYDQAHDALVARAALHNHILPSMGPFSSAGPFVTGPEWYYFIMISTAIFPYSVFTPWIVLTILYIAFVYIMILIGKEIGGKRLGIIIGLLSAVSTVQISQAINLTNQAPLSIFSALALFGIMKYFKTKNEWYLFLISLSVALGVNTHLQGVLLLPLIPLPILFERPSRKGFLLALSGLLIPFIPLLIFDFQHNHWESRNMLQYYLRDQYKIPLESFGRNWRTYLGIFWPNELAKMIGGYVQIVYIMIGVSIIIGAFTFVKNKIRWQIEIQNFIFVFFITFIIAILFLRYTHTPLFSSYLMFINPFIFIIVGWVINELIKKQPIIGYVFLLLLVCGSFIKDIQDMRYAQNFAQLQADTWKKTLYKKFPNQKFTLYDYSYKTATQSLVLSLFLTVDGKIDNDGHRIGVANFTSKFPYPWFPRLLRKGDYGYQLFDLSGSSSAQLDAAQWVFVNPDGIYKATENWYK